MARIDRPVGYRVDLVEYERGWGSKVDETIYFDNEAEAREYVEKFNAKNTEKVRSRFPGHRLWGEHWRDQCPVPGQGCGSDRL